MQMNLELPAEFQAELRNSVTNIVADALQGIAPTKPVPQYMGKGQVCEYLNISRNTLDSWIRKGTAPRFTLIGGTYRFKRTDIDLFMSEHAK